ncbi:hypothetical protein [Actinokineospora sp. UTMC 2448]|uniref:hypothetical protein n=1 Tax=Actinokineospora sp. UTMC 2448 TaxID=2268449 RepID=UPI002164BC23|nr:hypothetical protein [Actinokineospora sp. UTMC 2448]
MAVGEGWSVTPFLNELGKKLAERWLSRLVVPGLLLVAAVVVAVRWGHGSALDLAGARAWGEAVAVTVSRWSGLVQAGALIAVLVASAGVGVGVGAVAELVARPLWFGSWPGWLGRRGVARRVGRWWRWQDEVVRLRQEVPLDQRSPEVDRELARLSARRDRVSLAEPVRPTFTGDRLAATATRVGNQYGVDLVSVWMRLWVVLPEDVRAELRTARTRLDSAVALSVWAAAYAVLACWWWPAALVAVVAWATAWRRIRRAVVDHTELVEAVADVHLPKLAATLGLAPADTPMDHDIGARLNRLVRKGA